VLAVMISFLVLGIEGISSYIEEPFHVGLLLAGNCHCHAAQQLCLCTGTKPQDILKLLQSVETYW
jgi:predicted membrane chloride channel (bestrophin family)